MNQRIEVCPADELQPGDRKIVEVDGLPHSIGVFNVNGEYYALANVCPHHLAPLCKGEITGEMTSESVGDYQLTRKGEVIQCPWHGWKFNITDGISVFNPHTLRTRTYKATVESKTEDQTSEQKRETNEYGTALRGDEPPIDTYDVEIDKNTVVIYI